MQKYCPNCGEIYSGSETECPACHVPLEDVHPASGPDPAARLVPVLETTERGVLPLARLALEQEGIEFIVQNRGIADQIFGSRTSLTVGETRTPLLVLVREEDQARAEAVLRDLTAATPATTEPSRDTAVETRRASVAATPPPRPVSPGDVVITDADSGVTLGVLSEAQFDSLAAHLELESATDDDYYINEATIALLEEKSADAQAIALLRRALEGRPDVTIRWQRVA